MYTDLIAGERFLPSVGPAVSVQRGLGREALVADVAAQILRLVVPLHVAAQPGHHLQEALRSREVLQWHAVGTWWQCRARTVTHCAPSRGLPKVSITLVFLRWLMQQGNTQSPIHTRGRSRLFERKFPWKPFDIAYALCQHSHAQ